MEKSGAVISMAVYGYNFLVVLCVTSFLSCAQSVKHDPELAARRAVEFARVALVQQNVDKAYELLSPSTKGYVPREKFKETLSRLNPSGRPSRIMATEYEPMAGEKAIYIYIVGQDAGEQFEYTVTMEGTASTDYRVSKITRGASSYLPSTAEKKRFPQPIT
jgi:hypothetical protein